MVLLRRRSIPLVRSAVPLLVVCNKDLKDSPSETAGAKGGLLGGRVRWYGGSEETVLLMKNLVKLTNFESCEKREKEKKRRGYSIRYTNEATRS